MSWSSRSAAFVVMLLPLAVASGGRAAAAHSGRIFDKLCGVVADDLWLFGRDIAEAGDLASLQTAFALHWNGHSWTKIALPKLEPNSAITSASAVATDDVWAVGSAGETGLILHWDGRTWTRSYPQTAYPSLPTSVTSVAGSKQDAWAITLTYFANSGGFPYSAPTYQHWTGSQWVAAPLPTKTTSPDEFPVVDKLTNDRHGGIFAAGEGEYYQYPGYYIDIPVLSHWNGSNWSPIDLGFQPNPDVSVSFGPILGVNMTELFSVLITSKYNVIGSPNIWSAGAIRGSRILLHDLDRFGEFYNILAGSSSSDVWTFGSRHLIQVTHPSDSKSIAVHWTGSSWSRVELPETLPLTKSINDAVSFDNTDAWLIGNRGSVVIRANASLGSPLAEHWDGTTWSEVPVP